jgi:hypothetical protein
MGEYRTQKRTVYKYNLEGRSGFRDNSDAPLYFGNEKSPPVSLEQTTRSYRGSSDKDELLTEADAQSYALSAGTQFDSSRRYLSRFDNGHEFSTERTFLNLSHSHADFVGNFYGFHGPICIMHNQVGDSAANYSFTKAETVTESDLFSYGPKFISDTVPTKSVASLAQFLGELREGLPKFMGLSILSGKSSKSIADEYLNYQFGIKPFVNDLMKFAKAAQSSSKIIKQYERDSGRVVRRRTGVKPIIKSSNPIELAYQPSSFGNFGWKLDYSGQGLTPSYSEARGRAIRNEGGTFLPNMTAWYQTQERKSIWFSGAYSYYLNNGDDVISRFERYEQLANKLLGTRVDYNLLYQLTPWSWLIDWFLDIGNIISSTEALQKDGLVLRYGYIMCTTSYAEQYSISGFKFSKSSVPQLLATEYKHVRKTRVRATPYGFGLNPDSFSAGQWAILGALGMTKSPGNLRLK